MTSTYSTVYKDYEADSFHEAAEMMLRDPEIWAISPDGNEGDQSSYLMHNWKWTPPPIRDSSGTLRVWFQ